MKVILTYETQIEVVVDTHTLTVDSISATRQLGSPMSGISGYTSVSHQSVEGETFTRDELRCALGGRSGIRGGSGKSRYEHSHLLPHWRESSKGCHHRGQEGCTRVCPHPLSPPAPLLLVSRILPVGDEFLRHGRAIGTDRIVAEYVENKNRGFDTVYLSPHPLPIWRLERMAHNPRVITIEPFPVDIRIDGPWPFAGHNRNTRMLQTPPQAEVLIAFPGGGGTANCVETGVRMGIPVWQWEGDRERGEFREIAQ